MPTMKSGEKVSWKEFFKRWKSGMQNITPLQQCITNQIGYIVSLIGVIWGIVYSIRLQLWWLMIILIGSLFIIGTSYIGNWQKKQMFIEIERRVENE